MGNGYESLKQGGRLKTTAFLWQQSSEYFDIRCLGGLSVVKASSGQSKPPYRVFV